MLCGEDVEERGRRGERGIAGAVTSNFKPGATSGWQNPTE